MLTDRFWSKVKTSDTNFYDGTPCWEWTSSINSAGYGKFCLNGKSQRSHRLSYENTKGKIPKGLDLDHLCRNTSCVNPDHLESVTHKENCRRGMSGFVSGLKNSLKTHCKKGHEYNKKNTYIRPNGKRDCKICQQIRVIEYNHRKKMEKIIIIG